MRLIVGVILFLVFFALAGVGVHYMIYDKPGLFMWSLNENKAVVKTKIKPDGVTLVEAKDGEDKLVKIDETPIDAPESTKGAEPEKPVEPAPPADPNVISLFNGKDLGKWEKTQFGGEGDVFITEDGELEFDFGAIMTGVHWGEEPPRKSNYEITFDAMKLDGDDFFVGLTFPVQDSHASLIVGGWGGGVVGISSVDDLDASENETVTYEGFDENVWYKIRVRVTEEKIEAWIDQDKKVDLILEDRKISLRPGDIELCVPLGLASFITRAKYRNLVWTNLPENGSSDE